MLLGAKDGNSSTSRSGGSGRPAFEAPSVEALADALPAYEVQLLIGQGGMGAVYRARHRKLDRLVAIKVLRPFERDDPVLSADFTERFEREARVLAKLDHPHIVRIYDFGRAGSPEALFYLVLEYVDGASLRELMTEGRLSPREVLELIPQVCEALQSAHSLGVIHRDIKPENILVDSEGRVRIADFGLAKLRGLEPEGMGLTQSHQTFGSVHYMAPEQLRAAGAVDHRADLYSLGVIVYEMLTGELPLGRFAAPSDKSGSDRKFDEVVFKALENEPDERYQGAEDLKQDLVAEPERTSEPAATGLKHQGRRPARRRSTNAASKATSGGSKPGSSLGRQVEAFESKQLKQDLARSWSFVAILSLAYSMTWVEIAPHALVGNILGELGRGAGRMLGSGSINVSGQQFSVFGIPLWLGLLGVLAAAALRTFHSPDQPIDPRVPIAFGSFGTALILWALVSVVSQGFGSGIELGMILAVLAHLANSGLDFNSWISAKARRRLTGPRR
ncbi:Serine/threonine-protein kinase PknB [Planctomycetes bacterium Poly30]|uniref:Serine/threonine-protein kinase PknB n=2 Tax=Saltatorellus ferox TaxID=2528018 RepID=A0A518EMJ8_9BACT|nr:Serine/threonine-protein kinase PknB [Planctomycetes bacterium Poly30]